MACRDGVDTQNRERHGQVETQEGGHTSPRGECVPSRTTGTGADSRFPHKQDGGGMQGEIGAFAGITGKLEE